MPRFAKLELKETGPTYRCIDDGQWVGINNCTRTTETIANPSFVFSAIVARLAAMSSTRLAPPASVAKRIDQAFEASLRAVPAALQVDEHVVVDVVVGGCPADLA
jgi:hypothetical protein